VWARMAPILSAPPMALVMPGHRRSLPLTLHVPEILQSKVNSVAKITHPGRPPFVRKIYGPQAIGTGIALPVRRSLIERRVSAELARRSRSTRYGVSVAACTARTSLMSIMPYIEGYPLRLLCASKWPKSNQLRNLGKFIAETERGIGIPFFRGILLTSQRLGQIIRLYKTGSTAVRRGRYFSFGDVTLANLLSTQKGLHLLDFEFAHLSHGGFDIGMLTAEIDQLIKRGMALRYARTALIQGYISAGGKLGAVLMWRARLTKYQAARTTRNGG